MPIYCYHHISGVKDIETDIVYTEEQVYLTHFTSEADFLTFIENEKRKYHDVNFNIMLESNTSLNSCDPSNSAIISGVVLKSFFRLVGELPALKGFLGDLISEEVMSKSFIFENEDEYNKYCFLNERVDTYYKIGLFSDPDLYFLRRV